eukprot:CAMPEP_0202092938 /NCGR_PEP_ID=MMETSP0964-20121228/48289_1 /ASSEMBLY_ACC=CAM_ASM_000500 /TAXON_ID=4773 /ORGANISM="Schizochytrium aggregatum, Strain ATCC28209" /LENGTH=80 /DNA_ID=CAMNT_0048661183 /DNA_START=263 /DNA_END=506 /DNA_ORIENTATION=+
MMGNAVVTHVDPPVKWLRHAEQDVEQENMSATAGSSLAPRGASGGGACCQPLARAAPRRSEGARPRGEAKVRGPAAAEPE